MTAIGAWLALETMNDAVAVEVSGADALQRATAKPSRRNCRQTFRAP